MLSTKDFLTNTAGLRRARGMRVVTGHIKMYDKPAADSELL